jgi:DNA polymerase (family 10)
MPIYNTDVADVFDAIADYLEIEDENPFRIRAYRNAARTVRGLGPELAEMVARGEDLTELPGIGRELASKIAEILETSTAQALKTLQERVPVGIRDMLALPNLGPKRVRRLYRQLNVTDLGQLRQAAETGQLQELSGFGPRLEQQLLAVVGERITRAGRFSIAAVAPRAKALAEYLRAVPGVARVVVAGSLRRARETIGDLDILVSAGPECDVTDRLLEWEDVAEVIARGETKTSVRLRSGLQVDLRRVAEESLGAALQYFTGSRSHNVALRKLARQQGLKLNEYGVYKLERRVAGETEASVYEVLGLTEIPPELRENRGEIEAARRRGLPQLIELADLKGDLHVHTRASDGRNSLHEMVAAARRKGLSYLAFTEHSEHLKIAGGLDPSRLRRRLAAIDRLNAKCRSMTLLKGIEAEILKDGTLDVPDELLEQLDLVIGSVHTHLGLDSQKQTERILRAMEHPRFAMLAHPSGRLIEERPPIEVDMAQIIRQAARKGCLLELNANPRRLDLNDAYCRMAKEQGVPIAINSDAHGIADFGNLSFGIGQARRGWLEKSDVINTRPLEKIRNILKRTS